MGEIAGAMHHSRAVCASVFVDCTRSRDEDANRTTECKANFLYFLSDDCLDHRTQNIYSIIDRAFETLINKKILQRMKILI